MHPCSPWRFTFNFLPFFREEERKTEEKTRFFCVVDFVTQILLIPIPNALTYGARMLPDRVTVIANSKVSSMFPPHRWIDRSRLPLCTMLAVYKSHECRNLYLVSSRDRRAEFADTWHELACSCPKHSTRDFKQLELFSFSLGPLRML